MALAIHDELEDIDGKPWHYGLRLSCEKTLGMRISSDFLETANTPGATQKERRRIRQTAKRYTLEDGQLHYRDLDGELKICVASADVPTMLREFHDLPFGGHWGRGITLANIR